MPASFDMLRKGRGAAISPGNRYAHGQREAADDGWRPLGPDVDEPPPLRTTVTIQPARSIISRNNSPDIGFRQSINPYQGCEHGCIYCYARPSHAYLDLSPGLDFESRLFAKPNAAELLRAELSNPRYQPQTIVIGANTDPYQPIERDWQITRQLLEVMREFRHPVGIITKSATIERDIDILADLARDNLVHAAVSITTLDRNLHRVMEPRAAAPQRRIEVVRNLAEAGIPVSVMTAPIIPALNDRDMERILELSAAAGAKGAGYVLLRLPLELKELFRDWLARHFPDRAGHVMSLVRQMRGGRDYDADFATRHTGTGPFAALIAQRFRAACERLGLNCDWKPLSTSRFRRTASNPQLGLFDG